VLCPTGIKEVVPPATIKAEPGAVTPEIFTGALPVFVMFRLWVEVFPTETFPKLTLIALAERASVPGVEVGDAPTVLVVAG
jgi:hypothetical protein